MRIISWNVNGIRATYNKWELAKFITTYDPDIIFMQEIKAGHDKIPPELKAPKDYVTFYNPAEKPGYAGTGIWVHERVDKEYDLAFAQAFPLDPTANEWRVVHLTLTREKEVIDIFGIYFPNGGKSEEAWQGKLVFYREFAKYMDTLRDEGHAVLWGGDLNCAHHEIDLARPKENDGKIGFHPLERAWLDGRVADGWSDIWREKNPTTVDVYSWWDPVTRSRERNVGWRIDAWWGESSINAKVRDIKYLHHQMGSDHCPLFIELDL
jgi:exodeoxyribonuclease III